MSDDSFLGDLAQRLRELGVEMERVVLPSLKANVYNLKANYQSLLSLLKKRGLLSDDPYQFTEKVSDIQPVPNDPFLESQRLTVVSIRMHHFDTQLSFLSDYFQFSLETLTLPKLRALSQLLKYVRWESLTETSQEINTRMVAELVAKVRKSEDSISAGLVNDIANQLNVISAKVFEDLRKVTSFKREEYKNLLRTTFWSGLNFAAEEVLGNSDSIQHKIKKEFASHLKGQPYIQELVKELLDEDYAPNSKTLREELLAKLRVSQAVQNKPKPASDPRQDLVEAARTLATYNIPLDASLRKLQDNASLLDEGQASLGERFRRWIQSMMGVKAKSRVFVIDVVDPVTGATKQEQVDFDPFLAEGSTRVRLLAGMSNRSGPQYQALSQRSEDEILGWFERQFIDASKTVERINGLDLFFKTEVPKDRRSQVKGIKAEIAQIRTTMANSNKLRHEAVARKEEQEQLKRLGIKT